MKRYGRLHFGDIGKAFCLSFFLITIGWGAISHFSYGGIYVAWEILLGNLAVSAALSAIIYRVSYHRVLEYDEKGFRFYMGTTKTEAQWTDFSYVSLSHKGFGVLAVRLYKSDMEQNDYVEIPAGEMGIVASDFRFEAMKLTGND